MDRVDEIVMKRLILASAIAFSASASAHAESMQCSFESDYSFSQQGRTLIFSKAKAPGKRILIQDGRMVIDGSELNLSAEDRLASPSSNRKCAC